MSVTSASGFVPPASTDCGRQSGQSAAQKQEGSRLWHRRGWSNAEDRGAAACSRAGDIPDGERVCAGPELHEQPAVARIGERAADVVPALAITCRERRDTQRDEVVEQFERVARDKQIENRYGRWTGERPRRRECIGGEWIRRRGASSETTRRGAAGVEQELEPAAVRRDCGSRCRSSRQG